MITRYLLFATLAMVCAPAKEARAQLDINDQVVDRLGSERPWAKDVSDEQQDRAREAFARANTLIRDTLFAKAADTYREALMHWDHPAIHYNMAIALINLDQPIAAHTSIGKAMAYGPAPLGQDKYEQAQHYRKLLENQLGRIEITCAEPGARVTLDGNYLFTGPGTYGGMVRPGGHQLVASKPGRLPETRQIVLSPGQEERLEVVMWTLVDRRRWATWQPWAVVGAGALAAAAGSALHWRARQNFDGFDGRFHSLSCGKAGGCTTDELDDVLEDRLDRARLQQHIAVASYVVGGAAIAAGLFMAYLNRPRVTRQRGLAEHVSATPIITSRGAGVQLGFDF